MDDRDLPTDESGFNRGKEFLPSSKSDRISKPSSHNPKMTVDCFFDVKLQGP